jgi:hypothetical protein
MQLAVALVLSVLFLVSVMKLRPYRGTVFANEYAVLVNSLMVAVLFFALLLEVDRALELGLANNAALKFQLQGYGSGTLAYGLIALVSTAFISWGAFIAYDIEDTRDAKLLAKYVPPKDLKPGSTVAQLQLLEIEAELAGGADMEAQRSAMSTCFTAIRTLLDELVANGDSDKAQLNAVKNVAGLEHKAAYAACHAIVRCDALYSDMLACAAEAAKQYSGKAGDARTCKQQSGDLCALYAEAQEVLPMFSKQMDAVVALFDSRRTPKGGPAVKLHLSPLKHLYRCMEKMCLKGGKQRYMCFNICDIVRCIVECDDCENVTAVLQALQACRQIRMLRVKDRSNHLTSMNWMDIMVNVVLVADERVHVCEIQIVHAKMLLARAGLGGHGPCECEPQSGSGAANRSEANPVFANPPLPTPPQPSPSRVRYPPRRHRRQGARSDRDP